MSAQQEKVLFPPWVQRQLHMLTVRQGHAWLLAGPDGLNQFDLALALAQAWLCMQPTDDGFACGHCESCHMVHAHTHPDLRLLMPQETMLRLGWSEEEAGGSEDKKRQPSKEIRIEALRAMIEFTQRTPARGQGQVVMIYPAERMNAVSANTLLKTLEEPPGQTRFVLASENVQRLLPTIRSRCQLHAMHWPKEQEALIWLRERGVEMPEVMLAAAGGRPGQVLEMVAQGMTAQQWLDLPQALANGNVAAFDAMTVSRMLDLAGKLCHDLLAVSAGATPRFFPQRVLPSKASMSAVQAWSREVMLAARTAEHPWNAALYAQALSARAQQALRG